MRFIFYPQAIFFTNESVTNRQQHYFILKSFWQLWLVGCDGYTYFGCFGNQTCVEILGSSILACQVSLLPGVKFSKILPKTFT